MVTSRGKKSAYADGPVAVPERASPRGKAMIDGSANHFPNPVDYGVSLCILVTEGG